MITQYFDGGVVDFSHVQADLSDATDFQRRVLTACKRIEYGQTVSYGDLAKAVGQPKASRAAGAALATNPIPLVIPCHRVIGSSGEMVGFSAEQGTRLKKRLLDLEARAVAAVA
jgi:methylated-DNA-[protein]-cysteine S-methyltransferase